MHSVPHIRCALLLPRRRSSSRVRSTATGLAEDGTPKKRFMVCPLCLSSFGVRTPFCGEQVPGSSPPSSLNSS